VRIRRTTNAGAKPSPRLLRASIPPRRYSWTFWLDPHRTVDLDDLVRPALAGLCDADVFARGFRRLEAILATKTPARAHLGVDVQPAIAYLIAAVHRPRVPREPSSALAMPRDGE
jgi:hypothetical protein